MNVQVANSKTNWGLRKSRGSFYQYLKINMKSADAGNYKKNKS